MKTLRTLLSATALVLVAGAASAAPADAIQLGTENADSAVTQAYYPGGYPFCTYRLGWHYHYFHGFHFGWHKKCFFGYNPYYPGYPYYYKKNKP